MTCRIFDPLGHLFRNTSGKMFVAQTLVALAILAAPGVAAAQQMPEPWGTGGIPSIEGSPGLGVIAGGYRICEMTMRLFQLVEGNFGSLVMVLGGILAIVSSAFGAYRSAVSLLIIAVGAFILRSMVDIFFNFHECAGTLFLGGSP